MKNKLFSVFIIIAVLAAVGSMLYLENIRQEGEQVILKTRPVDPRSLLSGDYIRLAYEISDYNTVITEASMKNQDIYYLVLELDDTRRVKTVTPTLEKPTEGIYIKAEKKEDWQTTLELGIEQYYVPEGKWWTLEDLSRSWDIEVLVSLLNGKPQILDLLVNGKPVDFSQIEAENRYRK